MSDKRRAQTIAVSAEIQLPRVPNFLRYDGGTIDIAHVTDEDLQRIGHLWTQALITHARARREAQQSEGAAT